MSVNVHVVCRLKCTKETQQQFKRKVKSILVLYVYSYNSFDLRNIEMHLEYSWSICNEIRNV